MFLDDIYKWISGVPSDYSRLPISTSVPASESSSATATTPVWHVPGELIKLRRIPVRSTFCHLLPRWMRRHLFATTLLVLFILSGMGYAIYDLVVPDPGILPPTFEQYRDYERSLPQNNASLPLPEGAEGKFLFIDNYFTHAGWGNLLEELIMNAFLAYSSKRALVMYEFIWDEKQQQYTKYNGKYIPSRMPVSTSLAGPIAGGSIGPDAPRLVSRDYFEQVCPHKAIIRGDTVKITRSTTAGQIVNAWIEELDSLGERCVQIAKNTPRIFEYYIFGEKRLLDVWPRLSQSPIITHFAWSPLVRDAYLANRHLFEDVTEQEMGTSLGDLPRHDTRSDPYGLSIESADLDVMSELLVLHVRRGDFKDHCKYLRKHEVLYNAYNILPELPDKFEPPEDRRERDEYYRKHCYPNVEEMVRKVTEVQQQQKNLNRIYVMTNGKRPWLKSFVEALHAGGSWKYIWTSRDLLLTQEQKYVSQALDALVARRAEAFIGNGHDIEYRHAENSWEDGARINPFLVIGFLPVPTLQFELREHP
ncbi:hypothetical protein AMATHDRAFT_7764 [Amanita thiersii Skay4041]|uniref:Uncharacterized protein n=1 Tax=Amanita thiersii Skay4041 TaxID=703135 RepID=A0A2A9NFQ2_9AGAR|nr:hypothetical protein AMATHDRAFT_7764 [Amanita thiersii Skay4041]